jgi:hypothetical protein
MRLSVPIPTPRRQRRELETPRCNTTSYGEGPSAKTTTAPDQSGNKQILDYLDNSVSCYICQDEPVSSEKGSSDDSLQRVPPTEGQMRRKLPKMFKLLHQELGMFYERPQEAGCSCRERMGRSSRKDESNPASNTSTESTFDHTSRAGWASSQQF